MHACILKFLTTPAGDPPKLCKWIGMNWIGMDWNKLDWNWIVNVGMDWNEFVIIGMCWI